MTGPEALKAWDLLRAEIVEEMDDAKDRLVLAEDLGAVHFWQARYVGLEWVIERMRQYTKYGLPEG